MKRAILPILFLFTVSMKSAAVDQVVPFKLHRGFLVTVKCSVGDLTELTAIIDTGVTETVVDTSVAERLSLPARQESATFITQEAQVWAVSIPSLQMGPLRTGPLAGIATDLSSLTRQFGIRPDVLIGMDVLHRANFVIDYKARQLLFTRLASLPHSARLNPDQRFAVVESTVMRQQLRLQVDTGFQGLLVYRGRLRTLANHAKEEGLVETVTHALLAVSFVSSDVQIGNWNAPHLEVSFIDAAPRGFVGFDGLIGPRALRANRIAFDFENNLLYWD